MRRILVAFDERCQRHSANYAHVERPVRTAMAWAALQRDCLLEHCEHVTDVVAADAVLTGNEPGNLRRHPVHSEAHVRRIDATSTHAFGPDEEDTDEDEDLCPRCPETGAVLRPRYPDCIYLDDERDVFACRDTAQAARAAAGAFAALALRTAAAAAECRRRGGGSLDLCAGMAVVRPPGHHAAEAQASGFCIYNNVVVAARALQREGLAARVAIVDWDVHHGNGTQALVGGDPSILFVSLHRHDGGRFYPGTGAANSVGLCRPGPESDADVSTKDDEKRMHAVTNNVVNIPFPCGGYGDDAYQLAFEAVVVPVLRAFDADAVLVSAGFDAALGDPLGGMCVTPSGFRYMTERLMDVCGLRPSTTSTDTGEGSTRKGPRPLALVLEGGYNPAVLAECVVACTRALMTVDIPSPVAEKSKEPEGRTVAVLEYDGTTEDCAPSPAEQRALIAPKSARDPALLAALEQVLSVQREVHWPSLAETNLDDVMSLLSAN